MWQDLTTDDSYEIFSEYPYDIRNKRTKRILKGWIDTSGYRSIELNRIKYQYHRLIALQFIPNDNPDFDQIDHINGIKTDNRIENLRWTDNSGNNRNRNGYRNDYEFFEELPPFVDEVHWYKGRRIDEGYFKDDFNNVFYFNGVRYRLLTVYNERRRKPRVYIYINGKGTHVYPEHLI